MIHCLNLKEASTFFLTSRIGNIGFTFRFCLTAKNGLLLGCKKIERREVSRDITGIALSVVVSSIPKLRFW